jgi:RNA polymerase sigma-70 factor (ECF subfamily)
MNLDAGPAERPLAQWIARPLEALTTEQREILRLRVVVGLSAEQTAAALGTTAELVRVTQHSALNQLRRELGS